MGSHHQGATAVLSRWEATVGNSDTSSIPSPAETSAHTHSLRFSPKIFSLFNISCICLCVCSHMHMHRSRFPQRPEKGTESLEVKLKGSSASQCREPNPGVGRATSAFNHWSISPASLFTEFVRLKKWRGEAKLPPEILAARSPRKCCSNLPPFTSEGTEDLGMAMELSELSPSAWTQHQSYQILIPCFSPHLTGNIFAVYL